MNIDELIHYMMKGEQQNSAIPVPRSFLLFTVLHIRYVRPCLFLAFLAIKSRQNRFTVYLNSLLAVALTYIGDIMNVAIYII